jgi:hypothetical protein
MKNAGKRLFIVSIAAIFVGTCAGFAVAKDSVKAKSVSIDFSNQMILRGGQTLPAGTYRIEIPENSQHPVVTFEKDGKVMATARANVVSQARKNEQTSVESVQQGQSQVIQEIRPGGMREALVFGSRKS